MNLKRWYNAPVTAGTTDRRRNVWNRKGVIRVRGVGEAIGGGVGTRRDVGRCLG